MHFSGFEILPQLMLNGIIAGAIYSLVSSGFSLVYTSNRFINLAHSGVMMVGAYVLFTLFKIYHVPFFLACVATIIATGFFGWLLYALIYKPLRKKAASNVIMLIAAAGILIFLEGATLLVFGADVQQLQYLQVSEGLHFFGVTITWLQIVIVCVSCALLAGFFIFMKYAAWGKLIRAVCDNPELARISGVNTDAVQAWSFVLASAIAGVAAILISLERNIEPRLGIAFALVSFASTVVGGLGSLPGAILGSYLIGISENVGIWFIPSGYKESIWLVMLFFFLLLKPNGILGIDQGTRNTKI